MCSSKMLVRREALREKILNVNSMTLGGDKRFPYDDNLEGMTVAEHGRNYFSVGELVSFSEDPAEWRNIICVSLDIIVGPGRGSKIQ